METLRDYLTVWEGPDEIVWTFTATVSEGTSRLHREDWNNQIPKAVNYAARRVIANMHEGMSLVRELDRRNYRSGCAEAADGDVKYTRDYIGSVDITGCDYYVRKKPGPTYKASAGWCSAGTPSTTADPGLNGLQGFSWRKIRPDRERLCPSFAQTRFMAYGIMHGTPRGILYWGTQTIDDPLFRNPPRPHRRAVAADVPRERRSPGRGGHHR